MRTKGRVSERLGYLISRTIGSNERSLMGLLPTIWGPTRVFSPLQMALQINMAFTGVQKKNPHFEHPIWVFPKIMVPPNHPILIVVSIIFTIHFGGKIPLFLVQQPISFTRKNEGLGIFCQAKARWRFARSYRLRFSVGSPRGQNDVQHLHAHYTTRVARKDAWSLSFSK